MNKVPQTILFGVSPGGLAAPAITERDAFVNPGQHFDPLAAMRVHDEVILDYLVTHPDRNSEIIKRWYQHMAETGNVPAEFLRPQPGPDFDDYVNRLHEPPLRSKVWPRDYAEDIVRNVLAFVARGEFTFTGLWSFVEDGLGLPPAMEIIECTINRAKSEHRIRWCPYSQQYVARPAWQHRPKHDRRGWKWPT